MAVATRKELSYIPSRSTVSYEKTGSKVRLAFHVNETHTMIMDIEDAMELAEKIMELGALLDKLEEFGG